jgi:hypothetical protein
MKIPKAMTAPKTRMGGKRINDGDCKYGATFFISLEH